MGEKCEILYFWGEKVHLIVRKFLGNACWSF
jgi:hypothetical protein